MEPHCMTRHYSKRAVHGNKASSQTASGGRESARDVHRAAAHLRTSSSDARLSGTCATQSRHPAGRDSGSEAGRQRVSESGRQANRSPGEVVHLTCRILPPLPLPFIQPRSGMPGSVLTPLVFPMLGTWPPPPPPAAAVPPPLPRSPGLAAALPAAAPAPLWLRTPAASHSAALTGEMSRPRRPGM